ncbi:MAG: RnfABCDGE type electron transport complex subunit G [Candidatus Omnitrophica bacterium]|nr:RnfABCDGE type electron transport complex subunit G [Candidatus Omnitrophota bacterium]
MKKILRTTSILAGVCAVCAFLLALISGLAKDKIALNEEKKIENAIFNLSSSASKIEESYIDNSFIYKLFDKNNNIIGYAVLISGNGYQGQIKILVIVDSYFDKMEGIQIIESSETPGLGAKINEDSFKKQFKDIELSKPIECVKEKTEKDNEILAISGATISSKAVVSILNKELLLLKSTFSTLSKTNQENLESIPNKTKTLK